MKRILITGGAGSIGGQVTRSLAERGHSIRVFDLPVCDFSSLKALDGVDVFPGDITDPATVREAVDGMDTVLHLAALLPPVSERDRDKTYAVNVLGTGNIVDAIAAAGVPVRLVFSSTVATYGNTMDDDPPIRVDHSPSAVDLYGESKLEAESLILRAGIPYTILRISGVVIPALLEPPSPWPFMREQRMEFISRADVAQALLASVEQDEATNAIFNIAGGESWRMRGHEYVEQVYELLDVPIAEANYRQTPWWSDWYDTTASQALLGYQQTSFPAFLEQLDQAIVEALGW